MKSMKMYVKNLKKIRVNKYVLFFMIVLVFELLCISIPTRPIYAAQKVSAKNKQAAKAFNKYLSKNEIQWPNPKDGRKFPSSDYTFKYIELGKKKTPVLIITCNGVTHMEKFRSVMQYKNKKVKCVFQSDTIEELFEKKGLIVASNTNMGIATTSYYKLNGKQLLTRKAYYHENLSVHLYKEIKNSYYIGKKEVSKTKFASWLKKQTGGKSGSKLNTYSNTKKNRKKYLK